MQCKLATMSSVEYVRMEQALIICHVSFSHWLRPNRIPYENGLSALSLTTKGCHDPKLALSFRMSTVFRMQEMKHRRNGCYFVLLSLLRCTLYYWCTCFKPNDYFYMRISIFVQKLLETVNNSNVSSWQHIFSFRQSMYINKWCDLCHVFKMLWSTVENVIWK